MIVSEMKASNGVVVRIANDSISHSGSTEELFKIMEQRRAAHDVLVANTKKEVDTIGN